jgi:hypothetical protein
MKFKFIFSILLAIAFTFSAKAQQWVDFSMSEPSAPEFNLLTSTAQSVTFEVTIPGIYTKDTVVNGTAFTRLILPGGGAVNSAGFPEIPVLKYRVAVPICAGMAVASRVDSRQALDSCWVYPVPEFVLEQNSEGYEILTEQFTFNANAYGQPRSLEPVAVIFSNGSLRAQHYVEIMVQAVEFCPVTRQLSVIDKVEITLSFTNPQNDIRQNVGIFNKVATTAFINYEDDGKSALVNDKAFEKENFTQGNVQWITLTDTAQAKNIVADYLIITVPEFFNPSDSNSQLARLAQHRAFYNGYDVAILNVDDILSDAVGFYYEGINYNPPTQEFKKEQRIRSCIRRIYEGNLALHTKDDKLAYVLLVGDVYENNVGMPSSFDHNVDPWNTGSLSSDYYYGCVTKSSTGEYDHFADLFIGRFSVQDTTQLYNVVQKTINRETKFLFCPWLRTAGFTHSENYSSLTPFFNDFMSEIATEKGSKIL